MNGVRRQTADGILDEVALGGPIRLETLRQLLLLLATKTDYQFHIAVEIKTKAMLKTVDNEADALETIERLKGAPLPATESPMVRWVKDQL